MDAGWARRTVGVACGFRRGSDMTTDYDRWLNTVGGYSTSGEDPSRKLSGAAMHAMHTIFSTEFRSTAPSMHILAVRYCNCNQTSVAWT
jgi:hypothetical protein